MYLRITGATDYSAMCRPETHTSYFGIPLLPLRGLAVEGNQYPQPSDQTSKITNAVMVMSCLDKRARPSNILSIPMIKI